MVMGEVLYSHCPPRSCDSDEEGGNANKRGDSNRDERPRRKRDWAVNVTT